MLIDKILKTLYCSADPVEAIDEMLCIVGKTFGVSRSYIIELDDSTCKYDNTYEWCAEGIEPQKDNLADIPRVMVRIWEESFQADKAIRCNDIDALDDVSRVALSAQNIKAILVVPLYYKHDYIGFIGFDDCLSHRIWTDEDEQMLRKMANIVSTAVIAIARERQRSRIVEVSHSVLDSLNSAIYVANTLTKEILLSNKLFRDIQPQLIGTVCFYNSGNLTVPLLCKIEDIIYEPACTIQGCVRIIHSEINAKWYKLFTRAIRWLDGNMVLLGNVVDITDVKLAEDEMTRLASIDSMTGVFNRNVGIKKMAMAVESCKADNRAFAVAYIDVDNLKAVNDKYGHSEGDCMITAVAACLTRVIRDSDMICRLGGDEFLLMLIGCSEGEIDSVMSRVEGLLDAFVCESNKPYQIKISYGTYSIKWPYRADLQEVIHICDKLMYKHKNSKGTSRRRSDSVSM